MLVRWADRRTEPIDPLHLSAHEVTSPEQHNGMVGLQVVARTSDQSEVRKKRDPHYGIYNHLYFPREVNGSYGIELHSDRPESDRPGPNSIGPCLIAKESSGTRDNESKELKVPVWPKREQWRKEHRSRD